MSAQSPVPAPAQSRSRRRLRAIIASISLLSLGLGVLAGCTKPTPAINIVSSGHYQSTDALVWCFNGQHFTGPGSCAEHSAHQPRLKVRAGDQVSVEVPQEVRKRGWYVAVAVSGAGGKAQYQRGPIQKDHSYFSFTVPQFPHSQTMTVQVVAVGDGKQNSGIWQFYLLNKEVDG